LENVENEAIMAYINVLFQHFPQGSAENHEILRIVDVLVNI
jgi:hypothetical protein